MCRSRPKRKEARWVLRINDYRNLLEKAFPAGKRILGEGAPGIGKTFVKIQAAASCGYDYIGLCSALEDPSTIRGYPSRKAGSSEAEHLLFDGIARAFSATKPTVLDFDDLGMASESTMRAIMRLFQFGEIDGRRLPDGVVLSASTNDVGHGAGVYGMLEPLKSRFHSIIHVDTHVDDVVVYGLSRGWPSWLVAYVRNSPDALTDWKPEKSMKQGGCTPRGLEYVAEWDNLGVEDAEVWGGAIGKGRAVEALAYKGLIADLPDIDAILIAPETAPVPENPSARYLVSMALASRMSGATFGQCLKYLNRLPAMFRAFSIRDGFKVEQECRKLGKLTKDHKPLASSADFSGWACSEDGRQVMLAAS